MNRFAGVRDKLKELEDKWVHGQRTMDDLPVDPTLSPTEYSTLVEDTDSKWDQGNGVRYPV